MPATTMRAAGVRGAKAGARVLALAALAVAPAAAVEFEAGGARLSLDTTLSHGLSYRVADRDDNVIGVNSDDGDLNYDGIISNTSRFIGELDVDAGAFGAFGRVQGFVDFENRGGRERTPLPDEARDRVGEDIEVLDLYVSAGGDLGEMPVDARVGNMVLNWGESTFIQGGVNVISPFDVTRLRKPGAELREGLLPAPMASVAASPTPELSVEGFYQLRWAETRVDPSGTYFSTNDYGSPGGSIAYLANAQTRPLVSDLGGPNPATAEGRGLAQLIPAVNLALPGCTPTATGSFVGADCVRERDRRFLGVARAADEEPRDSGQWGVALRWYSEALNDTEFGFYFINHHSRLPLVSARYGTAAGVRNAAAAAGGVRAGVAAGVRQAVEAARPQIEAGAAAQVAAARPQIEAGVTQVVDAARPQIEAGVVQAVNAARSLIEQGVTQAFTQRVTAGVEADVPAATPNRSEVVAGAVAARLASDPVRAQISAAVQAETASRIMRGVEDQRAMLIAQGVKDQEAMLIANGVREKVAELTAEGIAAQARTIAGASTAFATDQYGKTARYFVEYPEDLKVFGFSFNTVLGASGWALQGEYSYHPDTPLQRTETSLFIEGLAPLNAALTAAANPTPANLAHAAETQKQLGAYLQGWVPRDVSQLQATLTKTFGPRFGADGSVFVAEAAVTRIHDMPDKDTLPLDTHGSGDTLVADATSWGYRVAGRLDYNNAVGAVRLSPYAQFQHDANGNSAGPSGPFLEGRTAFTAGLGLGWLDDVRMDLSYTMFGGSTNYLRGRDFVSVSASWSF